MCTLESSIHIDYVFEAKCERLHAQPLHAYTPLCEFIACLCNICPMQYGPKLSVSLDV